MMLRHCFISAPAKTLGTSDPRRTEPVFREASCQISAIGCQRHDGLAEDQAGMRARIQLLRVGQRKAFELLPVSVSNQPNRHRLNSPPPGVFATGFSVPLKVTRSVEGAEPSANASHKALSHWASANIECSKLRLRYPRTL